MTFVRGQKTFAVAPKAIANVFLRWPVMVPAYLPPSFLLGDNSFSIALFVDLVACVHCLVFAS